MDETTATETGSNLTSHVSPLTSVLCIGRNSGGLNTAVILENGDIYITGDNTYNQITNETSNIKINEEEYEIHVTAKTIETEQKETISKIQVQAANGAEQIHTLKIVKVSGNTNIKELSIKTKKEIENEETGEIGTEEKTEIIEQLEDGTYYIKIDRIDEIELKAILEEKTSKVKIQNSIYGIEQKEEKIQTIGEKTQITIEVKAEDDTTQKYKVTLEKKSNDTSLKEIESAQIIRQENNKIYVDEGMEQIELTLETNNKNASIKLENEEQYRKNQIIRTIDLNQEIEEGKEGIEVKIQNQEGKTIIENQEGKLTGELEIQDGITKQYKIIVTAENGNQKEYNLRITRISNNANLEYVKVNGEEKQPDKKGGQNYTIEISKQATTVEIEAKAENAKAKIKIGQNPEEIQTTKQTIDCSNLTKDEIETSIEITAEDGKTIKTYNIKLIRTGTIITGKIITENVEGKHKAIIKVYKTEEIEEILDKMGVP